MDSKLKEFMPAQVKIALGNRPTTHRNCIDATQVVDKNGKIVVGGIARPGKTAKELARRGGR